MPWARIDDRFHSHPKIVAASEHPYALGLHAQALSYCAAYLTDGVVHDGFISRAYPHPRRRHGACMALVKVGLWRVHPAGYEINDWLEYNQSAQEFRAQRAANADRQAAWRNRQAASSNAVTNALRNEVHNAAQTRPDLKEEKSEREERRQGRRQLGGPTHDQANAAGLSWEARKRELEEHP